MKKVAVTLFLAFVLVFSLSTSVLAEGNLPIGGKTCPPDTTCVTGNLPIGGISSGEILEDDATIYKTVIDYLAQFFG